MKQWIFPRGGLRPLSVRGLKGLSADLYMLTGEEVKLTANQPVTEQEFFANYHAKNWDKALEILRMSTLPVEEHLVALGRMLCWDALGANDVALLFAEYALKLKPDNVGYRTSVRQHRVLLGLEPASQVRMEISNPAFEEALLESIHEMSHHQTA